MKVKILDLTPDMAEHILPARVSGLIGDPSTICFGIIQPDIKGDTLLGVAIVSAQSDRSYTINHIQKTPDSDDEVYEALLTEIENDLRDNGARSIVARIIDTPDNLIEVVNALNTAGFVPVDLNGHYLMYSCNQLEDTPFYQLISSGKIQKYFSRIRKYDELDTSQIVRLSDVLKGSRFHGKTFSPDKDSSRYYVIEDEIIGMADVSFDKEASFLIRDLYVSAQKHDKFILPTLMASVLTEVESHCGDKGVLIVPIYDKAMYGWFKDIFGDGMLDLNIFEYVKLM